ncbi:MAG: biopolymer transporter ExbD [Bacteroidetes bacterium]|jgi:biopolymer transport protein ExbD|nr:MAG: biopolymer transporter ExbD [Bacteroidota bacterium]TAE72588.1 MAG: biopolymer transporter ExbD [Bacteroidota bacterium]TAF94233.1 MAG: biopolymer transporter ExbD [Bacteroidota bacterium]
MNIRKKLRGKPEIHNGALNDILFILLLFFLIVSTLANPNVIKVNNPKGTADTKVKQSVVVSINKDQQIFIGQQPIADLASLDTLLVQEVQKLKAFSDTPSVVINADTVSHYGEVFRVMQSAKKAGAKVVANVQ